MKVYVEENETIVEELVLIRCMKRNKRIEKLMDLIRRFEKTVPVEADGEKFQLSMNSIIYAETVDRRTYVYDDKKIYVFKESLVKLEQLLSHESFLRISKTTILNMHHLYSIKPYVNHRLLATLSNNETLLISRNYIKNLKEYLKNWED